MDLTMNKELKDIIKSQDKKIERLEDIIKTHLHFHIRYHVAQGNDEESTPLFVLTSFFEDDIKKL